MEVEIPGLPPKKEGADSMWAKGAEVPRLVLEGETIQTRTISPSCKFPEEDEGLKSTACPANSERPCLRVCLSSGTILPLPDI